MKKSTPNSHEIIKQNYIDGLWTEQMVRIALTKGIITQQQFDEIIASK